MATFFEDLWSSIFVPGPTPTLLIATNVAFAALQLLLLGLLIATYSIHFVILSCLCAGLWWSINWFSAELAREAAMVELKKEAEAKRREGKGEEAVGGGEFVGSETETESVGGDGDAALPGDMGPPPRPDAGAKATGLRPDDGLGGETVRRRRSLGDSSGYISTDSEWEKVDDEKDR